MSKDKPILYYLDYLSPLGVIRLFNLRQSHLICLVAIYLNENGPFNNTIKVKVNTKTKTPYVCQLTAQPAIENEIKKSFKPTVNWLNTYFKEPHTTPAKQPFCFESLRGTHFQKLVWKELCRIPAGHTISYSELAKRGQRPTAVRAVASACGKNPISILIPCHRVIAKSGLLGGYYWGLDKKQFLLNWEAKTTNHKNTKKEGLPN